MREQDNKIDFRVFSRIFTNGIRGTSRCFITGVSRAVLTVRFNSIRDKLHWKDTADSKPIITFAVAIDALCSACRVSGSSSNYKSELTGPRSICSLSLLCVHRTAITRKPLFLRFNVLSTMFPRFTCPATLRVQAALELRNFGDVCRRSAPQRTNV